MGSCFIKVWSSFHLLELVLTALGEMKVMQIGYVGKPKRPRQRHERKISTCIETQLVKQVQNEIN